MPIEIQLEPTKGVAARLSQGIVEFNRGAIPKLEPNEAEIRFHVVATGETGELIGGLRGA